MGMRQRGNFPNDKKPVFVYFLQEIETGLIKVGSSHDPLTRMRNIGYERKTKLVLIAQVPGTRWIESMICEEFAGQCAEGREWFRPSNEMTALIVRAAFQKSLGFFAEKVRAAARHA